MGRALCLGWAQGSLVPREQTSQLPPSPSTSCPGTVPGYQLTTHPCTNPILLSAPCWLRSPCNLAPIHRLGMEERPCFQPTEEDRGLLEQDSVTRGWCPSWVGSTPLCYSGFILGSCMGWERYLQSLLPPSHFCWGCCNRSTMLWALGRLWAQCLLSEAAVPQPLTSENGSWR